MLCYCRDAIPRIRSRVSCSGVSEHVPNTIHDRTRTGDPPWGSLAGDLRLAIAVLRTEYSVLIRVLRVAVDLLLLQKKDI